MLWDAYGADQAQYDSVVAGCAGTYGLTVLDGNTANGNYISSAESRTIWVAIDTPAQFMELFGKTLYANNAGDNRLPVLERPPVAAVRMEHPGAVVRYRQRPAAPNVA